MFTLQTVMPVEDVTAQLWFAPVVPWRWQLQSASEGSSSASATHRGRKKKKKNHPHLLKWLK